MLGEWRDAVLRHTPATPEVVDAGRYALGPAAGAALAVFAIVLLALGRRAGLAAGAVAMVAGLGVANYFRNVFPWWPEPRAELPPPGWHWVPLLFLLAQFDGLLARTPTVPVWGGWRLRLGIGFLAALLLVPNDLHKNWPLLVENGPFPFRAQVWPILAFTLVVALGWAGSQAVARTMSRGVVGFGLAFALFGAGFVLVHAHTARMADILSIAGAALFAVAVVAAIANVDVGGAVPGVAVLLPAILLVGATETFSEVPWYAFVLAGCPPLTIGLLAVPPMTRLAGFWKGILFWILCLGPTVAAVTLAVWKESLPGEEAW
jgi:hypothetical protein